MADCSLAEKLWNETDIQLGDQSYLCTDGVKTSQFTKDGELLHYVFDDVRTAYEAFLRGKKVSNDGACLGTRKASDSPYTWINYSTVEERLVSLGDGLTVLGIPPGQSSFIGIYGPNCAGWVIADLSNSAYSRVTVSLYDTLGMESISFIINQADISCVLCSSANVDKLLKVRSECPQLRTIIVFSESLEAETRTKVQESGMEIFTMNEIEDKGRTSSSQGSSSIQPARPEDLATLSYTSGTTGQPKGVMLTHKNIISNVAAAYVQTGYRNTPCGPEDIHVSYLPLAHVTERVVELLFYMCGGRVGFYRGQIQSLLSDIQELRPTLFLTVPRLLNKMYDLTLSTVEKSRIKKWLFNKGFQSKLAGVRRGEIRRDTIWDTIIFSKMQNMLGGRVRSIIFGTAPIGSAVKDFVLVAFGCKVYEGYGQTESSGGLTFTFPFDTSVGHVGSVFSCARIKLRDVPEMDYMVANGQGEVCFKGPCMTQGYYKNPEKTAELFDEDGWARTGDIGEWLPNGTLKIIDRVKHIFKLSQGEYIAPEKIENVCCRSLYISQMYVSGDSLRDYCIAVVVPDKPVLLDWLGREHQEMKDMPYEELCDNKIIQDMILADMKKIANNGGLNSLETPKKIVLCCEEFSVDNGLLTPTFKLKRPVLKSRFGEQLQVIYSA